MGNPTRPTLYTFLPMWPTESSKTWTPLQNLRKVGACNYFLGENWHGDCPKCVFSKRIMLSVLMISWVIEFICLLPIAESLPRTVESFVAYFGSILLVYHFESSYYYWSLLRMVWWIIYPYCYNTKNSIIPSYQDNSYSYKRVVYRSCQILHKKFGSNVVIEYIKPSY